MTAGLTILAAVLWAGAPAGAAPTAPVDIPVEADHAVAVTNVVYDAEGDDLTVSFDYALANGATSSQVIVSINGGFVPFIVEVTGSGSFSDTHTFPPVDPPVFAHATIDIRTTSGGIDRHNALYSFLRGVGSLPTPGLSAAPTGAVSESGAYEVRFDWEYPNAGIKGLFLRVDKIGDGLIGASEFLAPEDEFTESFEPGDYEVSAWYRYQEPGPHGAPVVLLEAGPEATVLFSVTAPTPAVAVSTASASTGGTVTVTGSGFEPDEPIEIWLHSTPVKLFSGTASSTGAVTQQVTIPASIPAGAHRIEIRGAASGSVFTDLTISLPATGGEIAAWLLPLAAVLILGGAALACMRLVRIGGRVARH